MWLIGYWGDMGVDQLSFFPRPFISGLVRQIITLIAVLSSSSMVEETTLELLSGLVAVFFSSSLVSFPAPVGGLKGDPEVPKMGK